MMCIPVVIFAALGVLSALVARWIFDSMPAKCFCDYDEVPEAQHEPPRVGRGQTAACAVVLGIVFAMLSLRFGMGVKSIALCLFSVTLVMTAVSDIKYCIIPDEMIIAGCVFAVVSAIPHIMTAQGFVNKLSPVFGAVIGAGVILGINMLGRLLYKKDALGMGDLKLMVVCGIACGAGGTLMALVIGILSAALFFAVGMALKRIRQGDYLPLGPFLVFATLFILCFRPLVDRLLAWYISLI